MSGSVDVGRWVVWAAGWVPALVYAALGLGLGFDAPSGLMRLLGVVVAISFPGLLLARWVSGRGEVEPIPLGLVAFAASAGAFGVNVAALRLAGVEVTPEAVLVLGGIEGGLATVFGWRRPFVVAAPDRAGVGAVVLTAVLVAGWAWRGLPEAQRELDTYWYHADPMRGDYEGLEETQIRYEGLPGGEIRGGAARVEATNGGTSAAEMRLLFLLQGPLGASQALRCGEVEASAVVLADVVEEPDEGAVPRYLDRGVAALVVREVLDPGEVLRCEVEMRGGDGRSRLVDLSGEPDWALYDGERDRGLRLSHYYQLLNIVENVRWAKETLGERWLVINQPPLWSWIYAAVVLYAGPSLLSLHVFFYLLIGAIALVSFRVVRYEWPKAPAWWALPGILLALSHAKIITASGSANFPDNLYALAVLAAFLGLAAGKTGLYVGAAVGASFLRYPGSVVALLAAGWVALVDRGRRRGAIRSASMFLGLLLVPCVLLGVGAAVTGRLGGWLEILWFETFPEHFHGEYDLAVLLPRAPEFYHLWLQYAGFTPVLLLAGVWGRLPRAAAGLALSYSVFLCFIDHFPSHYFAPLLALTGVVVTGSIGGWRRVPAWVGFAAASAGLGGWLWFGVP